MPKMDSDYTCLAVICLESDYKKDGNYHLQECKYIENKVDKTF